MALLFQGEMAHAQRLLEESLALCRRVGYKRGLALALVIKGIVVFGLGEDATARAAAHALFEEGLALARTGRWRQGIVWGLNGLGLVALFEQDYGTAEALFEEGLMLCRQLGNKTFATFYLDGLAMTVAAQGQLAWAAKLWGAAHRLRQAINAVVPLFVRPIHEHFVTSLRTRLGEEAFTVLWDQGRMMTLDQVLAAGEPAGASAPDGEESDQLQQR
jgi:hypothetical protein